jgi:4-hydroxy-tetrahydrodipicolinate synthase
VIKITIEEVKGKVPVIAGAGSNNTKEAEELTRFAKEAKADAALVITPYYNKPTPKGMEAHYRYLNNIGIPIIIYNVPSRTGVNIPPNTIAKLSHLPHIVGIKEASGDMDQVSSIVSLCEDDFCVLSGNDSDTLPILSLGGKGIISVVSNIIPEEIAKLVGAYLKGDAEEARQIHYKVYPLCKAMFVETNPLPVKTAMARLGMIEKEWRLPLEGMKRENEEKLEKALVDYGLI